MISATGKPSNSSFESVFDRVSASVSTGLILMKRMSFESNLLGLFPIAPLVFLDKGRTGLGLRESFVKQGCGASYVRNVPRKDYTKDKISLLTTSANS